MKVLQLTLALASAILLSNVASATSIAVSFAGDIGGGNGNNVGAGTAGVVPQANWNNVADASGAESDLMNDSGVPTPADVDWSSNNTWGGSSWFTADEAVVNGWLDDGGAGSSVTVDSIPFTEYDVYVYYSSDVGNDGRGNAISVNGDVKESGGAYTNLNANQTFFNGLVDGDTAAEDPTYFRWQGTVWCFPHNRRRPPDSSSVGRPGNSGCHQRFPDR